MTNFINDYKLSESDTKRIKCGMCDLPASTGQNNGTAPFWYHCDKHAEQARTTGHFYD